jgi:hypothetical protein
MSKDASSRFHNVSSFTYNDPSYLNIVKKNFIEISFKIKTKKKKRLEFGCALDIVGKPLMGRIWIS